MSRFLRTAASAAAAITLSGCMASMPPVGEPVRAPVAGKPSANTAASSTALQPVRWPVRTLEHVDLWLHAFAMLHGESAPVVPGGGASASAESTPSIVPLFRVGYRDSMTVVKNTRHLLTALDTNRTTLERGMRQRGGYLDAQFLPYAFPNWDAMRAAAERFLATNGARPADREEAVVFAQFAASFPSAEDRTWLRLFLASVQDEWVKFFHQEYANVLRDRVATITAIDSVWQQQYRPRFERFLANTAQRQGDFLLSLPIGGEGRMAPGRAQRPMVAVPFPARPAHAIESVYGFMHEVTGTLVGPVIADNTTPAEQREGRAARHVAVAQVVAGAMVLQEVAPELLDGYRRYYLQQAGVRVSSTRPLTTTFDATFVLPSAMRSALQRQVDLVLSGI